MRYVIQATGSRFYNSQILPNGSIDPARLTPRNTGFGAATGAQNMRNLQLMVRLGF